MEEIAAVVPPTHPPNLRICLYSLYSFNSFLFSMLCMLNSCVAGDNRSTVLGLNLMFLLVENRLAEFHSEVIERVITVWLLFCTSFKLKNCLTVCLFVITVGAIARCRAPNPHHCLPYNARAIPHGGSLQPNPISKVSHALTDILILHGFNRGNCTIFSGRMC